MYEAFYGLKDKPFSNLPNPGDLFLSKKHQTALTLLEYGLLNNVAFCVITGEEGVGKTVVAHAMSKRAAKKVNVGLVADMHQASVDWLALILSSFDLHQHDLQHDEMYRVFKDFLLEQRDCGHSVLLILDEAQVVEREVLEELVMLSSEQSEKKPLMQVILSGQPALKETLNQPELAQFARRIGVDYCLDSLNVIETCGYIQHRLVIAGAERDVFTPAACGSIYRYSGGNPGLINLLCETALTFGFSKQVALIDADHIAEMVSDRMQDVTLPIVNHGDIKEDPKQAIAVLEKYFPRIKSRKHAQLSNVGKRVSPGIPPQVNRQVETVTSSVIEDKNVPKKVKPVSVNEDKVFAGDERDKRQQSKEKEPSTESVKSASHAEQTALVEDTQEGWRNPFHRYVIPLGVIALLLFGGSQLFNNQQKAKDLSDVSDDTTTVPAVVVKPIVVEPDVVKLLKQHEQDVARIEQLQRETEALIQERDAVLVKFEEEKQALQTIEKKRKLEARRLEAGKREARKRLAAIKVKEGKVKADAERVKIESTRLEEEKRLMQMREDNRLTQKIEEQQTAEQAAAEAAREVKRKSLGCRGSLAIFKADCR